MKRFMMFALLVGALSLGACVDDSETQSVTDVRNAKAEQLKAAADLAAAQADATKTQADAQKALAEAQAEFQKAQAEAAKTQAAAEAALKEAEAAKLEAEAAVKKAEAEKIAAEAAVELAKAEQIAAQTEAEKAQAEANLKKAQAEADQAMAAAQKAQAQADAAKAKAEAAEAQAEAAKKQAELDAAKYMADMETLKWETEAKIAEMEAQIAAAKAHIQNSKDEQIQMLFNKYTTAVSDLNDFKSELIQAQYDLALFESGYATFQETCQKFIAAKEEEIAGYQNEIEAYKEYKGYDRTRLYEQIAQKEKEIEWAIAEFDANPVCAAIVSASEPIEKAVAEVVKQAELVNKVNENNYHVIDYKYNRYNSITKYSAVTFNRVIENGVIPSGVYYKDISVNEANKTAYENELARNIKYIADLLGAPEDREDKMVVIDDEYYYTAYANYARRQRQYDEAVANLENAKGEVSKKAEALKKAEDVYFPAKDALNAAREAYNKAWEDAEKAQEDANKAQNDLINAQYALAEAEALPDTDTTKAQKVADAKAAVTAAEAAEKTAKEALKAAIDKRKAAQETYSKKSDEYNAAEAAYYTALNEKNTAENTLENAENSVVRTQSYLNDAKQAVINRKAAYDNTVKEQKEFAEAFAAVNAEAVNAAATALEKAIDAYIEAIEAFEEARKPILKIADEISVLKVLSYNAVDVSAAISALEEQIALCQEQIDEVKAEMTDEVEKEHLEAEMDFVKAYIAELEQLIQTQTGIVDKAKAALDAALAE